MKFECTLLHLKFYVHFNFSKSEITSDMSVRDIISNWNMKHVQFRKNIPFFTSILVETVQKIITCLVYWINTKEISNSRPLSPIITLRFIISRKILFSRHVYNHIALKTIFTSDIQTVIPFSSNKIKIDQWKFQILSSK